MAPETELDNVLAANGPKSNRLVVQLASFEGRPILSVRRWFVDARTGQYCPTKKGISLARTAYHFLVKAMRDNESAISSWFAQDDPVHTLVRASREGQEMSARAAGFAARPFEVRAEEWSGPEFFRVDGAGGRDVLVLNKAHSTGRRIASTTSGNETVCALLVAFGRAARLVDCGIDGAAKEQIELLVANWGFVLQQYFTSDGR